MSYVLHDEIILLLMIIDEIFNGKYYFKKQRAMRCEHWVICP